MLMQRIVAIVVATWFVVLFYFTDKYKHKSPNNNEICCMANKIKHLGLPY